MNIEKLQIGKCQLKFTKKTSWKEGEISGASFFILQAPRDSGKRSLLQLSVIWAVDDQLSVVNFNPAIRCSSHRERTRIRSPLSYIDDWLVLCGLADRPLWLNRVPREPHVSGFQIKIQRPTTPILVLSVTYLDLRSTEETVTHKTRGTAEWVKE